MDRKIYGIFVAAGSGQRMGSKLPKQFLPLLGKPILQRTIEQFIEAEKDIKIIVVLPKEYINLWKQLCIHNSFHCPQIIVVGGLTRFLSVRNALKKVPDGAIVAIHDGVRPLVSTQLISTMLNEMKNHKALIPVTAVFDTLRSADPNLEAPDRSKLLAVQTPQIFHSEEIKKAYSQPFDTKFTDDASVASAYGIEVATIQGERYNIKITTPEDLKAAEILKKGADQKVLRL